MELRDAVLLEVAVGVREEDWEVVAVVEAVTLLDPLLVREGVTVAVAV